ncbi:MAG: transaldolase, partial [Acidimicrobiales bacterium]|nr:transaldolase [Acidimicrobiales bacterium]
MMLRDGSLAGLVSRGVRGVTANPTIFAKAIESSDCYDPAFERLARAGSPVRDAYWSLVCQDLTEACHLLRPIFDSCDGCDGFASVEVAPELAHDTAATIDAARDLHTRIGEANLLVKIPATSEGVPAIRATIGEGYSINITLLFSLVRYQQVIDAYLSGLEDLAARG